MKKILAGNQIQIRENNLSVVLDQLHSQSPLSRAQLAILTGLYKSTISGLVDELIARKLVVETGLRTSQTGRPGKLLEPNPRAGCAIGLEIGVDFFLIVIADFVGKILWRRHEIIETEASQEFILARIFRMVDQAKTAALEINQNILGIGITVPGMVDFEKGILAYSPNLGWRNAPLRQMFNNHTGLPVFVDNDATAAALGEHLFGNARQIKDFLLVMIGIGIGCGMFLDGKLYRGTGGFAGEIGHTILGVDVNRLCRCGHRGCWETYGNQYSLVERMRSRIDIGRRTLVSSFMAESNAPLSVGIITRAAEAGDPVALEVLSETGEAIGLGIANLIDIFNPNMVILGGALSIAGPYLLPSVKSVVEERSLGEPYRQTQLILSSFGTDAAVMGAVGSVVKAILTNPVNTEIQMPGG